MMNRPDRTKKVLLVLLVAGIWAQLLRPLFVASPAQAQQVSSQAGQGSTVVTSTQAVGETLYVFYSRGGTYFMKAFRTVPRGGTGGLLIQESEAKELSRN